MTTEEEQHDERLRRAGFVSWEEMPQEMQDRMAPYRLEDGVA